MATFKTDFSEYTAGVLPSDWNPIWVTTNSTWTIANVTGALGGKTLHHTSTADARRLIQWTTPGTLSGDFDILLKFRTTDSISGNIPTRIFAYASGSATQSTQQGYQLDALFPATLRIGRTVNGSYSTLASNTALPIAIQPNTWYWYRFQKVGTTLRGRIWADGATEQSTWDVSTTSTSLTSGGVGIGSYDYDGVRDYDFFSVGTNGDSAPLPVTAPPPDTTAPAEITNLTENHTDIVIEFNWTKPTDADFYGVNVYKNGTKIAGDLGSTFTDTNVVPDTTYSYRFTTVDTTGNESAGVTISVTTDPQKQYKHLKPTEIISLNNFTPNDVTYIQDDPTNEDANVLTTINNLSYPTIRLKFEQPDSPLTGLQTMRWVVDDPYYVGSRITIFDNGVQVYQSGYKYPLGGTQPVIENFNASVLTDKTLQNVEVELMASVYQGDTISNLGAIEWTFPVDETMVPIDGSIIGTSSASASLNKSYNMSGSLSVSSIVDGSIRNNRGLQGNSASISEVSNIQLERSFNVAGNVASFSDVESVVEINRGLSGQSDSHSSVNNPVLGLSFNVTGNVALVSDSASVIGIDRGIEGAIYSQSSLSVEMGGTKDLESVLSSFSNVSGELGILREIEGNVIEVKSTISPISLLKTIPIDGYIQADSINSGMIEKEMTLQGDIFGDSSVTGAVNRSILIDGFMVATSNVEQASLSNYREISGTVSGISSLTASFFVQGEITLTGGIINQSSISSSLTALKPLEGDVIADSFFNMEQVEVFRSINGEIKGNSSAESSLSKFMRMDGMIDEFSSLDGMVSRFILMDSSIEVNSSMESLLNKLVRLDSSVQAYSSLQDADLLGWRELNASVYGQSSIDAIISRLRSINGVIDVHSILSAEFSVEGEIGLDGDIFTLSSITGFTDVDRSITGMIESDSVMHPAFLNRGISMDGDIPSQSDISAFLSRLYGIEGSIGAISEIDGEINKRRSMSGRISSQNSLEASITMFWGMDGQIEGNADLQAESMVFYDLGGGLVAQSSLNGQAIILLDLTTETIAAVSTLLAEGLVNVSPPKIDVIRLNGQMMVRIELKAGQDIVSRLKAEHETVVRLDGDLSG